MIGVARLPILVVGKTLTCALRVWFMAYVEKWRSKNPYIVAVKRRPTLEHQWVLVLPTGATLSAPVLFDDDGDPVFSLPKKAELLAHVALRDCDLTDLDFRLLPEGGLEIDLGSVVVDRH